MMISNDCRNENELRVHVHEVVGEEPARDARDGRRHHERDDLGPRGVDAHRLGRDLVLADRDEARGRATSARCGRPRGRSPPRRSRSRRSWRASGCRRSPRAPPDGVDVEDDDADDLAEAQRDDRQVVAAQPQRRHADEEARDRGQHRADREGDEQHEAVAPELGQEREQADRSRSPKVTVKYAAGVGADRHEAGVADRELPGEAVDQVQAHRQDDVDAGQAQDLQDVRRHRDAGDRGRRTTGR